MAEKTAKELAQEQRDAIDVTVVKGDAAKENAEVIKEEVVAAETTTTEETIADNKDQIEANEQTAEELEEELAAAKTQKEREKTQKRIDKLTAKNDALAKENDDLKKKLAAKPDAEPVAEDEIERRANLRLEQREFANSVDRLFKAAIKIDKDFKKKIDEIVEDLGGLDIGGIPGYMIGILDDLDNGGDVLNYFVNNPDDYEEIRELSMSKMANRINKLSIKIETDKKKPKEISKVPKPITPPAGNQQASTVLTGKEDMNDFIRIRNKQIAEKEERRKAGFR